MVDETVDHAARAKHYLALSDTSTGGDPEYAALYAIQAQVHATLALVEATKANNIVTTYTVQP